MATGGRNAPAPRPCPGSSCWTQSPLLARTEQQGRGFLRRGGSGHRMRCVRDISLAPFTPGLAPPQWQVSPSRTPSNRLGLLNVRQEAPYTPRSLGFTKSDVAFANQIGRLGPLHPDPGGTGPGHGPPVGFGRESGPPRSRDDCAARQTSSAQAGLTASTVSRIYKPTYFLRVF